VQKWCECLFLYKAIQTAPLHVLKWIHAIEGRFAANGDLHMAAVVADDANALRWAFGVKSLHPMRSHELFRIAVSIGSTSALDWLYNSGFDRWNKKGRSARSARHAPVIESFAIGTVKRGHLSTLQWLHGKGLILKRDMLKRAAAYGHLPMVEWLHAQGFALSATVLIRAIQGVPDRCAGRRSPFRRCDAAHDKGCHVHGNIKVIEWLLHMGCPLPLGPTFVPGCCLHLVQVLHKYGLVQNSQPWMDGVRSLHPDVRLWLSTITVPS